MNIKTKKILDLYKKLYLLSFFVGISILMVHYINFSNFNIIAFVVNVIDFNIMSVFEGGRAIDPDNFVYFLIKTII